MSDARVDAGHGGVELRTGCCRSDAARQSRLRRLECRFDMLLDFVEPLSGLWLVGLVDRAEPFLGRLDSAALHAEKIDPRGFQSGVVAGRIESVLGLAAQLVEVGE